MSIDYAAEKFSVAVSTLATGSGDLKERLYDAFISGIARVQSVDLPEDLRARFNEMWEEATSKEPIRDEGTIMASLDQMDDERLRGLAEKIVGLGFDVAEAYARDTSY